MSSTPTLVIADDHPLVREGLVEHFRSGGVESFNVVGTASNAQQAVHCCREFHPDVLLLDVEMPGRDALGAMADIKSASPNTRIILLTAFCRDPIIEIALRNGASGYLLKSDQIPEIKKAVYRSLQGERVYSKDVQARMATSHPSHDTTNPATLLSTLHPRELEVLRYIGKGLSNSEMAPLMHISIRTVERHVLRLMRDLKIADRTKLTALAHQSGLVN